MNNLNNDNIKNTDNNASVNLSVLHDFINRFCGSDKIDRNEAVRTLEEMPDNEFVALATYLSDVHKNLRSILILIIDEIEQRRIK